MKDGAPAALCRASAPGKLVLLGEYAVLEGAPALVMAVDRRAHVTFQLLSNSDTFVIEAPTLGEKVALRWSETKLAPVGDEPIPSQLGLAVALVEHVFAIVPAKRGGGVLRLESDAFYHQGIKLGLGSSAAVAVAAFYALSRQLLRTAASDLDPAHAQRAAFEAIDHVHRKHQQGMGSGVDIAASTFGGLLRFEKERASAVPVDVTCDTAALAAAVEGRPRDAVPAPRRGHVLTPLAPLKSLCVTPIWTQAAANTVPFLAAFAALKKEQPGRYWAHLENLAAISQAGVELWHLGHIEGLLPLFNRYHDGMFALGRDLGVPIVTDMHAKLAKLVRGVGGAYKPSGAGGGDFGVAITRRGWQTLRLRLMLWRSGIPAMPLSLSTAGAEAAVTHRPAQPSKMSHR